MRLEWLFLAAVLLGTVWLLLRGGNRAGTVRKAALATFLAGAIATPLWYQTLAGRDTSRRQLTKLTPRQGGPDQYVTSDTCRSCHPGEYDSWHKTYHRTMTQYASPESVVGDFNNVRLELSGRTFLLRRRGGEYWVEMDDVETAAAKKGERGGNSRTWHRLGLLTGSHHMQAYWVPAERGNQQFLFPFAWLIKEGRWVPFHNTFLRDPHLAPINQSWNLNCMNCHATAGQARPNSQLKAFETRAGELGIACEACHGPAEEHVTKHQNPVIRYASRFSPAPDPTIANPSKLAAKVSSQVCGNCHSIKWIPDREDHLHHGSRYRPGKELADSAPVIRPTHLSEQPWLTEPLKRSPTFLRDRFWSDGMVRVSGREYNGLVESPCFKGGQFSCLSCHSMHQSQSPDDQLGRQKEGNHACLQCHEAIGNQLQQHTHHRAESSGSSCYNCHMPHTTYGLLKAIRSHQIDSPNVLTTVKTGRPNACNLCHLDKALGWTAGHLTKWYGQPAPELSEQQQTIAASVLHLLKGDAGQRALAAWSLGWAPAQQASGRDWMTPHLAQLLTDPYSAVRFIAARSLRDVSEQFRGAHYDFMSDEASRITARNRVIQAWAQQQRPRGVLNLPSVLVMDGRLELEKVEQLLREQDRTSMDLQE